jgi:glycyl-tRNA synthetase
MNTQKTDVTMEKIVNLCKRRGFIFPGSEIYGGLAGTYDYGPLGVALKKNITGLWWNMFVDSRTDIYGVDADILMNAKTWEATGHAATFADPLIDCKSCKERYRTDHLIDSIEKYTERINDEKDGDGNYPADFIQDGNILLGIAPSFYLAVNSINCPKCGKNTWGPSKQFNMMFTTRAGAAEDSSSLVYLRPETAQGMFVNFKNIVDTFHPKLSFGLAQIGKAFRNEIKPRDFIFRLRELEQMEIEYFIKESTWETEFEKWRQDIWSWTRAIGLPDESVHELEVSAEDRAFYSKRTIDFEFDFPFGKKELYGLAYRTDYDLRNHSEYSKVDLSYFEEETKERFIPHCIEPSFGVERTLLAVLSSSYKEEVLADGDVRTYLAFTPRVAPVKIAVLPLLKNREALTEKARSIYAELKKEFTFVEYDESGSVGKRYRKQDEIGTPFCLTVDFETIEADGSVTLRHRDTGLQERCTVAEVKEKVRAALAL